MTNREWLLTLTDEELAHFIICEAQKIRKQWTASENENKKENQSGKYNK